MTTLEQQAMELPIGCGCDYDESFECKYLRDRVCWRTADVVANFARDYAYKHTADLSAQLSAAERERGEARERVETLERMDREAATHVESVIAMRTAFTGDAPYVGWKGLGLALNEALDERDALRARLARIEEAAKVFVDQSKLFDAEENDGYVYDDDDGLDWVSQFIERTDLNVGHFRALRAAIKGE
jgi:hypothetical protein